MPLSLHEVRQHVIPLSPSGVRPPLMPLSLPEVALSGTGAGAARPVEVWQQPKC